MAAVSALVRRPAGRPSGRPAKRARTTSRSASRPRTARSASRTFTRTMSSKSASNGSGEHLDIAKSHLNIWISRVKKLFKPLGRFTYIQQNAGLVSSNTGVQAYGTILGHATISQLIADNTSPSGIQFNKNAFSLNPYQTNTGSNFLGSVTQPLQDRIHLHNVFCDLQLANQTSAPCHVELYWVMPTKASSVAPDTAWYNIAGTAEALGQAAAANTVDTGAVINLATPGAPNAGSYGETPQAHRGWRSMFKVIKKKSFPLASGGTHKVIYNINFNKTYDRFDTTTQNTAGSVHYQYGTVYVMIIVRGTPIMDTSAPAGGTGGVGGTPTTSQCEIAWTASHRYKFSTLGASRLDVSRITPQFIYNTGAAANIKTMGELNAAVQMVTV